MSFICMFIRCPRTNKVFHDPVITPSGICYERQAIESYTTDVLYPATFLQNYIQELLTNNIIQQDEVYVPDMRYKYNIKTIMNYFNNNKFDEIFGYDMFELSSMMDNGMIDMLFNNYNFERIQFVIDCCLDINDVDTNGDNIAMYAIKYNNIQVLKYLASKGCNFDNVNKENNTMLCQELDKPIYNIPIITCLIKNMNNINCKPYLMMIEEKENYVIIIKKLLKYNYDINMKNDGLTPLLYAVMYLPIYVVRFYKAYGANFNDVDNEGNNALHLAIKYHRGKIMSDYLVLSGVNLLQTNMYDETPKQLLEYNMINSEHVKISIGKRQRID